MSHVNMLAWHRAFHAVNDEEERNLARLDAKMVSDEALKQAQAERAKSQELEQIGDGDNDEETEDRQSSGTTPRLH